MIVAEMEERIREVIEALRPYDPDQVYLFGSWARGEADELSDLDIVVIKRTSSPFFQRLMEVARLLPASLSTPRPLRSRYWCQRARLACH